MLACSFLFWIDWMSWLLNGLGNTVFFRYWHLGRFSFLACSLFAALSD
jgi:hypothetical protein